MEKKLFTINKKNVEEYALKISSWISDIVRVNCQNGVVIGMSGGIDCSVVAKLCQLVSVDVHLVMMPYGKDMSNTGSDSHSMELIEGIKGVKYHTFDIEKTVDSLVINDSLISQITTKQNIALATANIRPRVRMTYLYQYAQIHNLLVAGTGNLSERTVGYFTKWGDGACDFNPIGMLTKQEVYILAEYLKVPQSIIGKKPSAGLWEGQTDEDELGVSYDKIDNYIFNDTSGDSYSDQIIKEKIVRAQHKYNAVPIYNN